MHLRMPSIDRGMVAIQVAKGTAFALSLVAGFLTFLIVRTRGGDDPRDSA